MNYPEMNNQIANAQPARQGAYRAGNEPLNVVAKKKRSPKIFDLVLIRARRFYEKSIFDRSAEVKGKSISHAVEMTCDLQYTKDCFYREYARRVDLLLDSRHFCNKCAELSLKPKTAAIHIVMLGIKTIEDIILHEGYKTLQPFPEWKDAFLADELKPYLENHENAADQGNLEEAGDKQPVDALPAKKAPAKKDAA